MYPGVARGGREHEGAGAGLATVRGGASSRAQQQRVAQRAQRQAGRVRRRQAWVGLRPRGRVGNELTWHATPHHTIT